MLVGVGVLVFFVVLTFFRWVPRAYDAATNVVVDGPSFWHGLDLDRPWCEEVLTSGEQLVRALDKYHQVNGEYPDSLAHVLPEAPLPAVPRHPSDHDPEGWFYARDKRFGYLLGARGQLGWAGAYDALCYVPIRGRLEDEFHGHRVYDVDGWLYVIGFSHYRRTNRIRLHWSKD